MRVLPLLLVVATLVVCHAAPQRQTSLQAGNHHGDSVPFIEEVVVESSLHVKTPTARQGRTNTKTSLQDGARISEMKPKYVNYS
nr:uncharacterized protein LOC128679916 [Plodia interpunctella]